MSALAVVNLSKYVLLPILLEWLETESFVVFDSAVCNHGQRTRYLELVSGEHFLFEKLLSSLTECPLSVNMIEWLTNREISLTSVASYKLTKPLLETWRTADDTRLETLLSRLSTCGLSIEVSSIVDEGVDLVKYFLGLHSITISKCVKDRDILEGVVTDRLCKICLMNCDSIVNSDVQVFLERSRCISDLTIMNCARVSCDVLCDFDRPLTALSLHPTFRYPGDEVQIRPICMSGMKSFSSNSATDDTLDQLRECCSATLTALDLFYSRFVTDRALSAVVSKCMKLTSISVSSCFGLGGDSFVSALADGCPHLTSVDLSCLSRLSDDSLSKLLKQCKKLEKVVLFEHFYITEESLVHFTDGFSELRALDLCEVNMPTELLSRILCRCPKLASIVFTCIDGKAYDGGMLLGSLHCRGWQLTTLDVSWSHCFDDCHFEALFPHCPNLTSVNMNNCSMISEESLLAAVRNCRLGYLGCDCDRLYVSSETVDSIIETQAYSIKKLELFQADISKEDADRLKSGLTRLRQLSALGWCSYGEAEGWKQVA